MEINEDNTAKGAIGKNGSMIISEYPSHRAGETHVCVFNKDTGKFTAGVYVGTSQTPSPYEMKANGNSGSALFFALMPIAMTDKEFCDEYNNLLKCKRDDYSDMTAAEKSAAILCDNLYKRIENADNLGDAGIKISIQTTGNIQPLNALNLNKGAYSPTDVICGTFEILKPADAPSAPRETVENTVFEGRYVLSERQFTNEEKQMIPTLAEWYVIPHEVVQICRHAKLTTESTVKMRNFMLRGSSGTGKTESARAVAAGLKLPYVYITCSANTEITDLLGQILPDVKTDTGSQTETAKTSDSKSIYPTFEDIRLDPATAYEKLTGIYDENVTGDEVYSKLVEKIHDDIINGQDNGEKQSFRYVDTALVNAIRYGWVCEIQEPSIIANPGVIVGLNSLLDNCKSVTLPTGEIIHRHPDAVLIVTTNTDYHGCKPMNQSFNSRMDLIFDVDEPDIATLTERVMKITKCVDETSIRSMAETVREISQRCRELAIRDGCCGARELISWVQSYMICGDMLEAANHTILSSVSSDPENRAEIKSTCLEPKYKTAS